VSNPVIKAFAYLLVHTPEFIRYGSKPWREMQHRPDLDQTLSNHQRSFEEAVRYPPNQVFLGNLHPEDLSGWPLPWWKNPVPEAAAEGAYGHFVDQELFYGYLKASDHFDLVWLTPEFTKRIGRRLQGHALFMQDDLHRLGEGKPIDDIRQAIDTGGSLPLFHRGECIGSFQRHHEEDESLQARILMENLMTKASGALVVRDLLQRSGLKQSDPEYLISCSEEAVGDRYNRGGGSMAKAVGEMCSLLNASGSDIKAFCAGPIYALVHGAALVKAGVHESVIVFGGGCLAKLGMKFEGHLKHDMPILEDVLGGIAFLITPDDGQSPIIRLDCLGKHAIGDGSSQQEIMTSLVARPLEKMGLGLTAVDKIATELHNPEVTVPQGSGNVPLNNYRLMAALAVLRGEIERTGIDDFVEQKGMPGFCPTQGHVPSAVPYLGHAAEAMRQGRIKNVLFVGKGSLFLGRMSQLSDGMSFIMQKNPALPE